MGTHTKSCSVEFWLRQPARSVPKHLLSVPFRHAQLALNHFPQRSKSPRLTRPVVSLFVRRSRHLLQSPATLSLWRNMERIRLLIGLEYGVSLSAQSRTLSRDHASNRWIHASSLKLYPLWSLSATNLSISLTSALFLAMEVCNALPSRANI